MKVENNLFEELEKSGIEISESQKQSMMSKLTDALNYEPRVAVFGKTGVGKSSLCNALFGRDLFKVSDVESCTRAPQEVLLGMGSNGLKLLDVPGVGENRERDEEYAKLYSSLLPELDLVLYLVKSDDRAFATDEAFYTEIIKPHIDEGKPFFFVISQTEKIEPFLEWDRENNSPSPKQLQNIEKKIDEVARVFKYPRSKVIAISAHQRYNLMNLVDEIIYALPDTKKITMFRQVSKEFRSKNAWEHVKEAFSKVFGFVVDVGKKILDIIFGEGWKPWRW